MGVAGESESDVVVTLVEASDGVGKSESDAVVNLVEASGGGGRVGKRRSVCFSIFPICTFDCVLGIYRITLRF